MRVQLKNPPAVIQYTPLTVTGRTRFQTRFRHYHRPCFFNLTDGKPVVRRPYQPPSLVVRFAGVVVGALGLTAIVSALIIELSL